MHNEPKPPVDHLTTYTLPELRDWYFRNKVSMETLKTRQAQIEEEVLRRVGDHFTESFAGKQSGDITTVLQDVKLKASIGKKVEWDSPKLLAIAGQMPWEQAQRLFSFDVKMPETVFKALTDDELLTKVKDARTVKYSPMKVSFASDAS